MDHLPEFAPLPPPLIDPAPPVPVPPPPFPNLAQAVGLTLLFLLLQFTAGLFVGILSGGRPPGAAAIAVINLLSFAGVIAIGSSWGKLTFRRVLPLRPIPLILVVPMFLTVIGASAIDSDLSNLVYWLIPPPSFVNEIFNDVLGGRSHPIMSLVLLAVVAPLTEEIFFRGMLLSGLLLRYRPWRAIVITAALFAFMHLNPWQFPTAMMLGVIFGWWLLRTRSLWPSLLGHAINNAIPAALATFALPNVSGYTASAASEAEFQPLWFNLAGLALALLGILWSRRIFARLPSPILARPLLPQAATEASIPL